MSIVLKLVEQESEKLIKLGNKPVSIGRSSKADIQIQDPTSSGKHCEIYVRESKVIAKDLGSRNGTLVNNHLIQEAYIYIDDVVKIGKVQIVIDQRHLTPIEKAANSRMDEISPASTIDIRVKDGLTSKRDVNMITAIHDLEETNLTIDKRIRTPVGGSPVVREINTAKQPSLAIQILRKLFSFLDKSEDEE